MICAVCGCSDARACFDEATGVGCYWIAPNLCSRCEFAVLALRCPARDERLPLYDGLALIRSP